MQDVLSPKLTKSLFEYLYEVYGQELYKATKDAPVWVSSSNHNKGEHCLHGHYRGYVRSV